MADFSTIIQEINDEITTNGVGAITGAKLNEVLRDMIAAVNTEKQDPITIDATPTEDSTNPVESGGVYVALQDVIHDAAHLYYTPDITDIPPTIYNLLQVGDVVRFGDNFTAGAIVTVIDSGMMYLVVPSNMLDVFEYNNGTYSGNIQYNFSDFAMKVGGNPNGNFAGLNASGDLTDSGKKASDFATPIPVVDASTIPASMEPNKLYKYGTLSGDTVFPSLATPTDQSRANVYWWKFTTPASTINVQMPSSITIWNGGQAPTIDPSTTYEITVEDGFGTCIKS